MVRIPAGRRGGPGEKRNILRRLFSRRLFSRRLFSRRLFSRRPADRETRETADRDGPLPLSFDQERMWLVDRLFPASVADDEPVMARVRGPLNIPALDAAVGVAASRHESLRTRFPLRDGAPGQVVDPYTPARIRILDLAGPGAPPLAAVVAQERARPFALESGSPFRAGVLRLAPEDHVILLSVHHLAADLWSIAVLLEELSSAYSSACAGRPHRLQPPLGQPAELGRRQRRRLTPARMSALRERCRDRLGGVRPVDLPSDRPRRALPNLGSHSRESVLDHELSTGLRRLGAAEAVTLFGTLLAGLHALISRWSGAADFAVVSVSAGRHGSETERTVGLLTECLVLRLSAPGDPTFRELLAAARDSALDAFDAAKLPFAEVVALLDPARDREPSPLRQFGLSVHNVPRAKTPLPGLAPAALPEPEPGASAGRSEADLWLEVFDSGHGELPIRLQLDDVLFAPASLPLVEQLLVALLRDAVARPEARISELAFERPARWRTHAPARPEPAGKPAPSTAAGVAELVGEVLGARNVAGDDNFFRLGGTSMDAARLASRVQRRFGVEIGLYAIATARTVDGIAAAVERESR
ncbi:hypothetical protein G3I59_27755 [Amycolatopsis rubida]|uniref:Carrier domain-containing protein n=1 Tax=Amycolatopsis rubida TaxID=112413 RepID=A0ABX0BV85_9PSEU|nr:hypothetical protein [Amycolatopsis rubida]NEC59281.1 hypothetical protein [Amycolatopsis rubida]